MWYYNLLPTVIRRAFIVMFVIGNQADFLNTINMDGTG